mmetsp:Transcript_28371/g.52999  ORF Transcript_28371/g.52999 Transcript_28371/m.52999 type:complete len:102 (+) Transcript_28371:475-780(+)
MKNDCTVKTLKSRIRRKRNESLAQFSSRNKLKLEHLAASTKEEASKELGKLREKLQAYEKLKQKEEANVKLLQKQLADALLRVQKISKIQQELKANMAADA